MAIKKAYLNVILFTTAYKLITSISIKRQPLRSLRALYIQLISCQSTCRCSSTTDDNNPFYVWRNCGIIFFFFFFPRSRWNQSFEFHFDISFPPFFGWIKKFVKLKKFQRSEIILVLYKKYFQKLLRGKNFNSKIREFFSIFQIFKISNNYRVIYVFNYI